VAGCNAKADTSDGILMSLGRFKSAAHVARPTGSMADIVVRARDPEGAGGFVVN